MLPSDRRESREDLQEEPREFQDADGATRPTGAVRGSVAGGESGVELIREGMDEYTSSSSSARVV